MKLKQFGPILEPTGEIEAIFNCGAAEHLGDIYLLPRVPRKGFTRRKDSHEFENFVSDIWLAKSKEGINFTLSSEPFIKADKSYDIYGCEDPRVTKFEDEFYIFYTAMSVPAYTPFGSRIGLATTRDFKEVHKYGVIGPRSNTKAAALFPERIHGKLAMIFTREPDTPDSSIVIAFLDNVDQLLNLPESYWEKFTSSLDKHLVFPAPEGCLRGPEVGAPPLKTPNGWLLLYCGPAYGRNMYSISAALLDLENPRKVLRAPKELILEPKENYELEGLTPNVTFPEGAVIMKDELFVYYGGADRTCCVATCKLDDLIHFILTEKQ